MECYKISKLFVAKLCQICGKQWVEVSDLSSGLYYVNKNITLKTLRLRSYLCDYSDAYLVVKETIHLLA